jgi:phosphate transport system substrate-binding protein
MSMSPRRMLVGPIAAVAINALGATTYAADRIAIDGSSTVFPITEAMAEEFQKAHGDVHVTAGIAGTGGGFEKFCRGEIAIADASRPIEEDERAMCQKNGIDYIELPVALDALTVVVNSQNNWAQCMTVAALKKIWEPAAQGKITNWSQVRQGWPDEQLVLYGPGADSGTFDYFTEAVVGEEGAIRGDFNPSEDDNVLVQGVSRTPGALGYFGLAYYTENNDILKAVAIDGGNGCVKPSVATAKSGAYQPLSRPLFIYVSKKAAEKAYVREFAEFYLNAKRASKLVAQVGYVPLPANAYQMAMQNFKHRELGTAFASGETVSMSIKDLLKKEKVH